MIQCDMSEQRQREHPRFAIELDAEIDLGDGTTRIRGRTHDISRGGFSMLAKAMDTSSVTAGSPCTVRLALVFSENEFSEHITLAGAVMWCTRLREGVQVGVKFALTDAQSRGYLDLFIHFLEEGEEDESGAKS